LHQFVVKTVTAATAATGSVQAVYFFFCWPCENS
jgi:hypothetical protein